MKWSFTPLSVILLCLSAFVSAETGVNDASCGRQSSKVPAPVLAPGFKASVLTDGLTDPRGIKFDNRGRLLVVESGKGISAITFSGTGACVQRTSYTSVITDDSLNHGITFSNDYKWLYASSVAEVRRWPYDSNTGKVTSNTPQRVIYNLGESGHVTRTLAMSSIAPGQLIVTRGSQGNIDPAARDKSTGSSQIRSFDMNVPNPSYNYATQGTLLGWGLRNDVGVDEEPHYGGIFSVENSVDQMQRNKVDIHQTNPGEKLNYLGTLNNNKSPNQGANFGYPDCFAAWDVSSVPNNANLKVGLQFAIDGGNASDMQCMVQRSPPRNVFHPHTAPLSIKFHPFGWGAWITFHGSWNSAPPVGYKVSWLDFDAATGQPVAASTVAGPERDLMWNADNTKCPGQCFRPVGISWDSGGARIFVSSDSTGEIYAVSNLTQSSETTNTAAAANDTSSGNRVDPPSFWASAAKAPVVWTLACLVLIFLLVDLYS